MKSTERVYRGRKTKWFYIGRYYEIVRDVWPKMKEMENALLLQGRLSVRAYKYECNLNRVEEYKWLKKRIERAEKKSDPLSNLDQINIYRLEQSIDVIDAWLLKTYEFLTKQENFPLEETDGYVYNRQFGITQDELLSVVETENGFEKVDDVLED